MELNAENLKKFIKSRRAQADDLIGGKFTYNSKKDKELRRQNAYVLNWFSDQLEHEFPVLKE